MVSASSSAYERYLYKPFRGSSHFWAIDRLKKFSAESAVLDIGCGGGAIGHALKENGFKNLFAVEVDPPSRERAESIYKVVYDDLLKVEKKDFDIIILLDVLEHLPDALSFLTKALEHLKPGGRLLISLPNVAHWSVRFPLLFGSFEYRERGIMDRTHLHFYTRASARSLIKSTAKLHVEETDVSIEPVEFLLPDYLTDNVAFDALRTLRISFARILPGLMAYQNLFLLRKI